MRPRKKTPGFVFTKRHRPSKGYRYREHYVLRKRKRGVSVTR